MNKYKKVSNKIYKNVPEIDKEEELTKLQARKITMEKMLAKIENEITELNSL